MGGALHVGVLTTSYPRWPEDPAGGFVAGLNRHLLQAGHRVTVVAAGEDQGEERPEALRVHRVPSPLFYRGGAPDALVGARGGLRVPALLLGAGFSLALLQRAARALRDADVLLSHWVLPCGFLAALCARGRRHITIAHSSDVHLLRRLRAAGALRWLARRAQVVYSSPALQVPGAPGRVVPMGVECADFAARHPQERAAARATLGLQSDQPLVLALARLVPVKGLDVLLTALHGPGRADRYQVLVAGEGPLGPALRQRAQALGLAGRVRFLGEVRGAQRRALLLAADLLVLPSLRLPDGRTEGAPTVLCEALAAGCPVVASAVGGVAETLGECGRLCPPGDPQALALALREALAPPWLDAARAAAPLRARRFDWSVIGPRIFAPVTPLSPER